jgi:SOS regulatory protein LexA
MDIEKIKTTLRKFHSKHKRLPSYTELAKLFNYSSRNGGFKFARRLIELGIIAKDTNGQLIPKNLFSLPLLGMIKAGYPMPAEVQEDRYLNLHLLFDTMSSASYALTVSGDSMSDAGIYEGDIVIIDKKREPTNGDIVAACVDNEWTVKYFQKQGDRVSLLPANRKYPEISPTQSLEIGGVVIHVIRSYR